MLLSMTGYGEAHHQSDELAVSVEVRSINSRYFKLSLRANDIYGALEPHADAVVRKQIKRGTVQINLRVDRNFSPDDYRINEAVLKSYEQQLQQLSEHLHLPKPTGLESLLALPGVVDESSLRTIDFDNEWPVIEQALQKALQNLTRMRQAEGSAMAKDLHQNCQTVNDQLDKIKLRGPTVVQAYQTRLRDRLNKLLQDFDVTVDASDVVREVGLFAERSDISEEVVRLRSHLSQFESIMNSTASPGRKLEFLIQEMFRETNTIGSKANDSEISKHVVEIKSAIERMREMVQNVE